MTTTTPPQPREAVLVIQRDNDIAELFLNSDGSQGALLFRRGAGGPRDAWHSSADVDESSRRV